MFSKRTKSVDSSGIRRVFDLAAKLKDPINLSIGQPFFDSSLEVKEAACEAINSRRNGYTVTQGIPELREIVSNRYGITAGDGQSCCITSGTSGGLLLSYMAMLDPGDEILIPDPFFCMYRDVATLINAVPKYYDTYPDFRVRRAELDANVSAKTKAIVLSSPGNPTGRAISEAEFATVVDFARQHDLWIIYDEIYSAFSFDVPHVEAYGRYEKTVILNGFSKSHGVPGWRVGFAVGPSALIQELCKLQQYTFVCAPSIAQYGLLKSPQVDLETQLSEYRSNRDLICDALSAAFTFEKPDGAFYLFPEAPGGSGQSFVERCISQSLLVVPGNVFSRRDSHFRISFSAPKQELQRGIEVLLRLANTAIA